MGNDGYLGAGWNIKVKFDAWEACFSIGILPFGGMHFARRP